MERNNAEKPITESQMIYIGKLIHEAPWNVMQAVKEMSVLERRLVREAVLLHGMNMDKPRQERVISTVMREHMKKSWLDLLRS